MAKNDKYLQYAKSRKKTQLHIDLQQLACSLQYLLTEPNAEDPLNDDAAALLIQDPIQFQLKVDEVCHRTNSGNHL